MALLNTKKCEHCGYKNAADATVCNLCSNKMAAGPPVMGAQAARGTARQPIPEDHFMYEPRMLGAGATKRMSPMAGGAPIAVDRHFMVPPTGDPVQVDAGKSYILGREESCQIRIVAPRVSRKHAEVRFEGTPPAPIVADLGSQNGTYVNGAYLAAHGKHPLKDRDVVDIGGVSTTYRLLKAGAALSSLREGGEQTMVVEAEPSADLVGNAAFLPLGEVLARLEKLAATGLLLVDADGAKGALRIENGKAAAGSFAGLEGDPAITAVRSLTKGKFRFEAHDPDAAPEEVHVPASEAERPTRPMGGSAPGTPAPGRPSSGKLTPMNPPPPQPGRPTPPPKPGR